MSNDQQIKTKGPSSAVAGSGPSSGRGRAPAVPLSFLAHHDEGGQHFWPSNPESEQHLDDRHEGELRALELLRYYRDSERTAAPLLRRILGDALTEDAVDMPPHLDGFLRVIDDLLRLSARVVSLDEYGRALVLQQQAEKADERRRRPAGKPE